ncbi:hypothetical protein P175DRAFT_0508630 [Aspergillus ochraceoroseus IBT 24754]|uniref:DUF1765-domain-containing protein n=3 Tax=Aspergillus subgen. Nidulantes TaxID=2720870 RepID=A0A0F8WPG4_9EURO|nr:uncharacterized protein P175DRAFT_0508630 [Aspergillus ochraceoroseus IBT 24754]KKK19585.1 hypothetical protein ARAM_006535 [Aspergillus rambellii]KKK22312.1 hypothetical protein AOCH_003380 [Aspergillus ochraceoroseus]PTU21703.1 hypothetical protein P175DRAFT_0508630 [Aspergillus ochraceoroseus IBT 24754]
MSTPAPEIENPIENPRQDDQTTLLSRAASYNHLPNLAASEPGSPGLRRTFSDLTFQKQPESPSKEDVAAGKDILRRTSLRSKDKSTIAVSRFTVSTEDLAEAAPPSEPPQPAKVPQTRAPSPVARPSKARSMSGRLVSFARKPWMSSSPYRSPSPSSKASRPPPLPADDSASQSLSKNPRKLDPAPGSDPATPSRKRTILNKRPRRPMVAVVTQSRNESPSTPSSPSPQSLITKNSLDRLASSMNISTPVLPPMPKITATSGNVSGNPDPPRKKDELWGVFRGLEADFQKFQSKSSALKANVIRSSLLPFLNRTHPHISFKELRPEDLDRRVNILNKWWTGLLDMLNGKHNQSVSGTDRPVYLEAVVGIMTRSEWRIPFPMPPSNGNPPKPLKHTSTSISETSEASSGSDFLLESIHHNIRNIFTQNLLSQMAFVVERMSMRHAPASLVSFCGKACAYAFFFCPGVADILVRLWNTPPNIVRRVYAEWHLEKGVGQRSVAQDLALNFPIALRTLSFHAPPALIRYLRQKPDVPLNTSQIQWQSPWVSRWCGRDTDLFYVFAKYVHLLYADAIPSDLEKSRRILAPGLLPIHAQILVALEDTLYKQSQPQLPDNSHATTAITFDDFIEGADGSASALPLGAANSHRSMAENRLIILLRDFLSESSLEPNHARLLYAESFCMIMKTAAQRTSLFDHNACFLLCDLVEEVIPIISRYSHSVEMDLLDWKFWLEACGQMMRSHNSLTEVRVFSFLFCIWGTWTSSEERKADLCLRFLLDESLFYHYFSHWSPMVRAYFHRLLCWRLGRFNGEPSPLDSVIYEALSSRLQRLWEYYLAVQNKAEKGLSAPLSSAPCTPAPGRRIIIIRCDNQLSPSNLFVSFDRVVPPALSDKTSLSSSHSKTDALPEPQNSSKKRWNLLKAMFGGSAGSRTNGDMSPTSSSDESDTGIPDATVAPDKGPDGQWRLQNTSGEVNRPKTAHQPYFFKFSLEWMDRPQWPSKNKRLYTPCLPVASQLHLQFRRSLLKTDDCETLSDDASDLETEEDTHAAGSDAGESSTDTNSDPKNLLHQQPDPNIAADDKLVSSKYAGRALAEWAQIVSECDSFFARRRDEGVPCDRMVETPTLGVEGFRK